MGGLKFIMVTCCCAIYGDCANLAVGFSPRSGGESFLQTFSLSLAATGVTLLRGKVTKTRRGGPRTPIASALDISMCTVNRPRPTAVVKRYHREYKNIEEYLKIVFARAVSGCIDGGYYKV